MSLPWSCRDGAGSYCVIHPRKPGPESKPPSSGRGCWVPFSSACFQRAAKHLHHKPHQPLPSSLLPGAGLLGLLSAVATQSLQTRVGGRQQQSQSTERKGPSGAVRPQTEKLPHRTCMRTEGSLARAAEAQLPGSKQNRFLREDEGSEGAKG